MSTKQLFVELSKIEVPKKWRPTSKAVVESIGRSFAEEGQLQAIGVRPHPTRDGAYELVYGKHRLEAARLIGWNEIEAKYLAFDDDLAASATIAENLFRNELTPGQRIVALKTQEERYLKRHPEASSKAAGGHGKARATHGDPGESTPSFPEATSKQTNIPAKTIERYLAAGRNLNSEQLGVLAESPKTTLADIRAINKLGEAKRQEVTTLVAAGMAAKEAIARANLPAGTTAETVGSDDDARAEAEMSDAEWLETYCGEVIARLKYAAAYKKDALLYRHTREPRQRFRAASKKPLAQSKAQLVGPFYLIYAKLVNVDHPRNWLPCGPCGGSGMHTDKSKCGHCYGHAFVVKTAASGGAR